MTHEDQTEIRAIISKYRQQAQDAEYRDQIASSCRLIQRHAEGVVDDAMKIVEMPNFKTEAEDALNQTERVLKLSLQAIVAAKASIGTKQLERN